MYSFRCKRLKKLNISLVTFLSLLILSTVVFVGSATAAVINVSAGGSIQAAINAAVDGDNPIHPPEPGTLPTVPPNGY